MTVLALSPALAEQTPEIRAAAVYEALDAADLPPRSLLLRLERLSPWEPGDALSLQVLHVIETYGRWLTLSERGPLTPDEDDDLVTLKRDVDKAVRELVSAR